MSVTILKGNEVVTHIGSARCYYRVRRKNGKSYVSERCTNDRVDDGIYCDDHRRLVRKAHILAANRCSWGMLS